MRLNLSASGQEALGTTSPYAAAGTLVAFLAMQDLFGQVGLANLNQDIFAALGHASNTTFDLDRFSRRRRGKPRGSSVTWGPGHRRVRLPLIVRSLVLADAEQTALKSQVEVVA